MGYRANRAAVSGNDRLDDACGQVLLDLRAAAPDLRSLVVTGCGGGEGVTTIACALARAAHRLGSSRVLLIDAAPSAKGLTAILAPGGQPGLRQFRNAKAGLPGLVLPYGPGIGVLPQGAGSGPALPSEQELAALVEQALQAHDLVIWDAAPITGSIDAKRLVMLVGAVMLVAETDRTRSTQVIAAMDQIRALSAEPLGVIRNRAGRAPFGFGTRRS